MTGRDGAGRHAWIDASAGVAGDMLLGALVDAGADLAVVQRAVDAVVPGAVRLTVADVQRAGLRALKLTAAVTVDEPPHRTWRQIRDLLDAADLPDPVRHHAHATFARLAETEGQVHGVPTEQVSFHEVGALDSIADTVGVCAALADLGVTTCSASPVAVGSGQVRTQHGELPVPVPAVAQLARGWRVRAGGVGELATPTGMALVRTLAPVCEQLPDLTVHTVGVGAGTRDTPGRANVVRVIVGASTGAPDGGDAAMVQLATNVDDLDPRLWPGVLAELLDAGAADAWLVPILMKKGRPAHTLCVLCETDRAPALQAMIFAHTSTLGVRRVPLYRTALPRTAVMVTVGAAAGGAGGDVSVKLGHLDGVITQVMPEFADVAALARAQGRPQRQVLAEALAAATAAGLVVGARLRP